MKENWRPSQKFVLQRHWKLCANISPSVTNRLLGNYSAKSLEPPLCLALRASLESGKAHSHVSPLLTNKYLILTVVHVIVKQQDMNAILCIKCRITC